MSNTIDLSVYAPVISSDEVAGGIYETIKKSLGETEGEVIIDFSSIRIISTKCAKLIFGQLYVELGPQTFFDRIIIQNANENVRPSISDGIESILND